MSTDREVNKEDVEHIHTHTHTHTHIYIHTMEYYSAIEKNEIMPFAHLIVVGCLNETAL